MKGLSEPCTEATLIGTDLHSILKLTCFKDPGLPGTPEFRRDQFSKEYLTVKWGAAEAEVT